MEANNFIDTTKNNSLAQIDLTKPQIPYFSRLPDPVKKMILDQGEKQFKKDIDSNNSKVLGLLSQQLNMQQFQNVLGPLNPGTALDGLFKLAQGNFLSAVQQLFGFGGGGVAPASLGNFMGGMGANIGSIGQQALNGLTNGFSGGR